MVIITAIIGIFTMATITAMCGMTLGITPTSMATILIGIMVIITTLTTLGWVQASQGGVDILPLIPIIAVRPMRLLAVREALAVLQRACHLPLVQV